MPRSLWWHVGSQSECLGKVLGKQSTIKFCYFPGLLSLEHRLKESFESWFRFLRQVSEGKTMTLMSERLRLIFSFTFYLSELGEVTWSLYISISSCAKCRQNLLEILLKMTCAISIEWKTQCLMTVFFPNSLPAVYSLPHSWVCGLGPSYPFTL